jgi:hypothetical protein
MQSSGKLHSVAIVRTDVSEEPSASTITATKICRLLIAADVGPSLQILVTLKIEALGSSERSVLTRAIRRHFPEDAILEDLKSYIALTGWTL